VYIDLNMVRAGAVRHPSEWPFCGYNEIKAPPQRYTLIDQKLLMTLLVIDNSKEFSKKYNGWVEAVIKSKGVKSTLDSFCALRMSQA
jgi:putative transposase